jgi:hypothetical protein
MSEQPKWIVCVKGGTLTSRFSEIAVCRSDYAEGISSFGHFSPKKMLIAHNGGPAKMERNVADRKLIMWPVCEIVWDKLIKLAHEIADTYNAYEA